MLEISTFMASPGGGNSAGKLDDTSEVGVVGSIIDGFREAERRRSGEEGDRNSVGNRWPRQETLALLKIRSDMDVAFRDSALKGPLWEEVSRKLAELGYHRSAKKCKEKFENVYKYHKRTKEDRASKPNGRIYRFFDQLEALHNQLSVQPENKRTPATTLTTMPATNPIAIAPLNSAPLYLQNLTADFTSASTASSSSSGEESEGTRKKNIKWAAFFDGLMKELIEKQESLQKKFLEAIEKRERDRMVREEAWKMQEMERMNRRHEILAQERSIAAAKDAALTAFLQKISEQSNPVQLQENSSPSDKTLDNNRRCDHGEISVRRVDSTVNLGFGSSSSRWPNAEVQALIKLRTSLDLKYHETGPKGPFWEEISSAMRKLGYDRSAKRCKEKWENINKYFKKVKESKKRRPEDSKTCPYFHQLDALYREKTKKMDNSFKQNGFGVKAEDLVVQMMSSTEQREDQLGQKSVLDDLGDENLDQNQEEEDGDDGGEAENVAANNPSSVVIE